MSRIDIDLDTAVTIFCITILIVLFWGEPDIQDAIIVYLQK